MAYIRLYGGMISKYFKYKPEVVMFESCPALHAWLTCLAGFIWSLVSILHFRLRIAPMFEMARSTMW